MGFDIQMVEAPKPAEAKKAGLPSDDPGYFRFQVQAMPAMVVTMVWAGAMTDDEEAPKFPKWPPDGVAQDRVTLMEKAVNDPKALAKLTPAEHKRVDEIQRFFHVHSKHAGTVPAFKFRTNDGYVVDPDECATIATRLRAFAPKVTAAQLEKLGAVYAASPNPGLDAAKTRGEQVIVGNESLGLTLEEYRAWILQWATYNEVASHHHGYRIE
jgi:hypothetical protein